MVKYLCFGNWSGVSSGSGRYTSSKVLVRDHRWKPCDSPTGDVENGGVAKDELVVVSVRESALGDVEVIPW